MDNGLVHGDIRHTAMSARQVLILIVVDNGLVHKSKDYTIQGDDVLILIVVDNGLVLDLIRHY